MKHAPAWSADEQQLLDRCRQYDGPCDAQLGDALLTLIEVVFKRASQERQPEKERRVGAGVAFMCARVVVFARSYTDQRACEVDVGGAQWVSATPGVGGGRVGVVGVATP